MNLGWHNYKYFPYELDLARREVEAILGAPVYNSSLSGVSLLQGADAQAARRLTYFANVSQGETAAPTTQARLEEAANSGQRRQATRYSVHGMHEYKGKFNPQVAKAVLNIFGIDQHSRILDPFCGSGTTLVEAAHLQADAQGIDINPMAVYVANAKTESLRTPAIAIQEDFLRLTKALKRPRLKASCISDRHRYLALWFESEQFDTIENLRNRIVDTCSQPHVFLAIASNLLRDYSNQDPADLRVRRRSTPVPVVPFEIAFSSAVKKFLGKLEGVQSIIGICSSPANARVGDARSIDKTPGLAFDAAVTSPPYATALPYIDTQRLSLVWLALTEPEDLAPLDGALIGSREIKRKAQERLFRELSDNAGKLPDEQAAFCRTLARSIGADDGFRRKAVPALIYRYLIEMQQAFRSVRSHMAPGAPFALVVGHNHTILSGIRFDINTPHHLAQLAVSAGWRFEEAIPMQTYRRYGLHAENAVSAETLLLLRNSG